MRNYELVFILTPQLPEEEVPNVIQRITQSITAKGGEVVKVDRWGKRRFAYPLKHFQEGDYVLAQFKLEPKEAKSLEDNLRVSEDVLRHLLVNLEG